MMNEPFYPRWGSLDIAKHKSYRRNGRVFRKKEYRLMRELFEPGLTELRTRKRAQDREGRLIRKRLVKELIDAGK